MCQAWESEFKAMAATQQRRLEVVAQRDRYRKALEQIADYWVAGDLTDWEDQHAVRDIARNALRDEPLATKEHR